MFLGLLCKIFFCAVDKSRIIWYNINSKSSQYFSCSSKGLYV